MSTLATLVASVKARVKDAAEKLSTDDYVRAVVSALGEYSKDRPRIVSALITGAGVFDYPVTAFGLPAAGAVPSTQWQPGFSSLYSVTYPFVVSNRALPLLDEDEYGVVPLTTGEVLRLAGYTPSVTDQLLVRYSRPHEVTEAYSTVSAHDEQAVCDLAASYALTMLAAYYAQATDSSLSADVADHRGRTSTYLELARTYQGAYYVHVGRESSGGHSTPPAAGTIVDLDRSFTGSGIGYFFHGRRFT